jgi:5-methylcytosine-specific restriction endonuclease McrA
MEDNPGNAGYWDCYLRISLICLGQMDEQRLTLEHVIPKGRGEKYRYDPNNIKPACAYCNSLKGSRTIKSLTKDYPHLKALTS